MERTFTFGQAHINPRTGKSLGNNYVVIKGKTIDECRAIMHNHFDVYWAFEYATPEAAGKDRYNLIELPKEAWPHSTNMYGLNDKGICVYLG